MSTDVTIRFRSESAQAQRNIQALRETQVQLNRAILENQNALLGATGEERRRLQAIQAANRVQAAAIRQQIQETQIRKQAVTALQQEERARQQAARATERANEQSRQATQQLTAGIAISAGLAARQLGQLTTGFVQAAANMETFRASLNSVTGNAEETDRILQRLLGVTVELVGIDTGDLISFAARLMATGLTADQTITALRGVTERVAEQGKSAEVTTRVLEQFTQAINSNTITAQDFRPIARELPTLFRDAGNALGTTITSLDDFRNASEAVGGPTQAIILLLEEMARASGGADLNTLNAQLDILQDQSRILAAELGEHLVPAVVSIVRTLNDWIQTFNEMDDDVQAAIAWAAALSTGIAALTAVAGGAVVAFGALSGSLAAITGTSGLAGLGTLASQTAGGLGRFAGVLGRVGSVGNLAATAFVTLTQAWTQIYNDFQQTAPFEDAVDSIQSLDLSASQTAQSLGLTAEALSGVSQDVRTEIELLVERADQLRSALTRAINQGDTEAARDFREEYRHVNAQIQELTETLPPVVEGIDAATAAIAALAENTPPAVQFTRELSDASVSLQTIAAQLTPSLQASALAVTGFTEDIYELQSRLERYAEYGARLDAFSVRVVDAEAEKKALEEVIALIVQQTQDAEGLADAYRNLTERTDAHNAALVDPAVSDAARSMRDYTSIISDVNLGYDKIIPITQDFVDGLVDQTSAFDDLRAQVDIAEISLDDIDATFNAIPDSIDPMVISMEDFETVALRALRDIGSELSAFEGNLGAVGMAVDNLVTLFANPVSFAAGTLGNVIEGLANLENFAGPLGLPEGFFDAPTPGQAVINNQPTLEDAQYQDFVDIVLGRRGGYEDPIAFLLENAPGLIERFRPRIDADPRLGSADIYNRLFPQATGPISSFTRSPDFDVDAEYAATFEETGTRAVDAAATDIPDLSTVFRFTGEQRGILAPLENAVTAAQDFIDDFLTADSTPEEIQAAYTRLTDAEQALYNQQVAFINNATHITEDARTRALRVAEQLFDREIRDANLDLVDALENIGFQLVNILTFTSGILRDTALSVERIPQEVEAVPEPEAPPELSDRFGLTNAQRRQLAPFLTEITNAQQAIGLLSDRSTPEEITAAYTRLATAEQMYLNQQLAFIEEGVGTFTSGALQEARDSAIGRFDRQLFAANTTLVRNLERVGFSLVNMFTETSGFLQGLDLRIQRIPIPETPQNRQTHAPELRDSFRFTADQDTALRPFRTEITNAQRAISLLTDTSTPEEITDAYTRLATAEQMYLQQQLAFINVGVGIFTDTALQEARDDAIARAGTSAFNANSRLIGNLERVGFQLTTMFDETSGFLTGTALAIEAIPIPETPEAPDIPEATDIPDLDTVFRFTGEQRDTLNTLRGTATEAEETLNRLRREGTATPDQIHAAYTAFATASAAVLEQEVAFISEATNITEDARQNALTQANQRFRGEIFDANSALISGLENLGFELTHTLLDWFGVLQGAALEVQQIPADIPEAPTPLSPAVFAQNALRRARFGIQTATDEGSFDAAVRSAIAATHAYYDAEDARIEGLGHAEDELRDKREDLDQDRREALYRYENIENPFRERRIQAAADEAERLQRIEERAIQDRLREEMRLQDELSDLREDALETERERQQELLDLEQETQDRIADIHRDALREREDLHREFASDFQDTDFQFREQIAELLLGEGISARDVNRFFSGFESDVRSRLSESGLAQLREIEGERANLRIALQQDFDRGISGIDRQTGRDIEDTETRALREAEAVNLQAQQALIEIQQGIAATEQETVMLASITTSMESQNAVAHSENLMAEMGVVAGLTEATGTQLTAGNTLTTAATTLLGSAQALGTVVEPMRQAANTLSRLLSQNRGIATPSGSILTGGEFAQAVLTPLTTPQPQALVVSPQGGGTPFPVGSDGSRTQQPIVIQNNLRTTVDLDSRTLGQAMDETLVTLDQDGRSVGSYRRN